MSGNNIDKRRKQLDLSKLKTDQLQIPKDSLSGFVDLTSPSRLAADNPSLSKKLVIGRTYSEQIIGNTCSFKAFKEHRCIGNDSIIHKFYTFDEKTDQYGKGAYGVVYKAKMIVSGTPCAIKRVPKDKKYNETVKNELEILSNMTHPNIVKVYQLLETDNFYYIVTEDCTGGELFMLLDNWVKTNNYSEKSVVKVICQVLEAINHAHQKGIVHRDIKPENIMLENEENLRIRVIDFGCSATIEPGQRLNDMMGSYMYMAPDVWNLSSGKKADVWSIGIITFMMLTGKYPFENAKTPNELKSFVNEVPIKTLIKKYCKDSDVDVSKEGRDFLEKALL